MGATAYADPAGTTGPSPGRRCPAATAAPCRSPAATAARRRRRHAERHAPSRRCRRRRSRGPARGPSAGRRARTPASGCVGEKSGLTGSTPCQMMSGRSRRRARCRGRTCAAAGPGAACAGRSARVTKRRKSAFCLGQRPVDPADLVVLAPGVVVAAAACAGTRRRPAASARPARAAASPSGSCACRRRRREDVRVVGRPLDAAVPASSCRRSRRGCPRRWPRCACWL